MSANIAWGPAVSVDGKPDWVNPHDLIRWSNNGRPYQEVVAGQVRQWGDQDNKIMIRLGSDHPYYASDPTASVSQEEWEEAIGRLELATGRVRQRLERALVYAEALATPATSA